MGETFDQAKQRAEDVANEKSITKRREALKQLLTLLEVDKVHAQLDRQTSESLQNPEVDDGRFPSSNQIASLQKNNGYQFMFVVGEFTWAQVVTNVIEFMNLEIDGAKKRATKGGNAKPPLIKPDITSALRTVIQTADKRELEMDAWFLGSYCRINIK
jgi:hypothetical protein